MRATAIGCALMFWAFAGSAQTLTCTFQFVGSGTVGLQSFTNANITITSIAFTANIDTYSGGVYINNTSASISISGVGAFQFMATSAVQMVWVWLLWNDGPGGVETALVLIDVELPVTIKVA